jgi:outer membrane protein assembly factor BamB
MKQFKMFICALGLAFISCNQNNQSAPNLTETSSTNEEHSLTQKSDSKAEIQNLVREVLKWADSERAIDLLPAVADKNDSVYIGFDLEKLKKNLERLEETNMFSKQFIENYNQIILTLDRKLKTNGFEDGPWFVGYLPPFNFASDANPWCLCQDVPYDTPVPWELVELESVDGQTYSWKWGGLKKGTDPSWEEFRYKFKVTQENSKWKISYLEGFAIEMVLSSRNGTASADTDPTDTRYTKNILNVNNKLLIESRIVKGDVFKPQEFAIELSKRTITADIHGHLSSGESIKKIDFGDSFYTRKIHFLETGRAVILFFEITDDEGSFNEVYCLDVQGLSTIWKTTLYSFNLTVGEEEAEVLYLGAGENAYALDIEKGKVIWQTTGLYHKHGFNYFDSIEVTPKEIRLTGKSYSKEIGDRYRTAVLHKAEGKLLTVE